MSDNQSSKPNISVVIPAYNRAKTIRYCMDSVLFQTVSPFEVIVVDDCSNDNTVKIVRSYNDPRVRCVLLDNNSGAQVARNRGIREAKGDWIAFLDSDDEWVLDKLEKQVEALSKVNFNPMTVVHTDCWRYEESLDLKELWNLPFVNELTPISILLRSPGPMFQGILTSKAALEAICYLDEKVPSYQEWDTAIRLAKVCRFVHIREPLFTYHLHEGNTISKDRQRDIDGYQYIVNKFCNEIVIYCGKGVYNSHLVNNALRAVKWGFRETALNILQRDPSRAMKLLCFLCRKGSGELSMSHLSHVLKRFHLL